MKLSRGWRHLLARRPAFTCLALAACPGPVQHDLEFPTDITPSADGGRDAGANDGGATSDGGPTGQYAGHGCLGLAPLGTFWSRSLVLGSSRAFISNETSGSTGVLRFEKSLTAVTPLTQTLAQALATDATHIYFGETRGLQRVPQAGGAVETVVAGAVPSAIAIDDTTVYWVETTWVGGLESGTSSCSLFRADKAGGTPTALGQLATDCGPADLVLVTSGGPSGLYFMRGGDLMRAPFDGTGPVVAATMNAAAGSSSLTRDDTSFYLALFQEGTILSVPLSGGAVQTLAQGLRFPVSLVAAADSLYWIDTGGTVSLLDTGTVMKLAKTGGTPTVLASGLHDAPHLVVDDTSVYWLDRPSSNLSKTAK